MKFFLRVLACIALVAMPLSATAQARGGGHFGGFHGGFGGFRGGFYRGWGWGFPFWFYPYWLSWGAFCPGLGVLSVDPWYYCYPYNYYGPDYYYGPAYAPPPYYPGYNNQMPAPPPSSQGSPGPAPPQQDYACGNWVWHAQENRYDWVPGPCPTPSTAPKSTG